jgi:hypothetical protein
MPLWRTPLVLLLVALALFSLHACGGPTYVVEQYSGPRRSADSIAILRFGGTDDARLVVIDGERADVTIAEDARLHVEVLPGEHRLGVISRGDPYGPLQRVAFVAEAGKVYRVVFQNGVAKAYEIDSGSDALVRDVTRIEPPEVPLAPRPPPPPPEELAPAEPVEPPATTESDAAAQPVAPDAGSAP